MRKREDVERYPNGRIKYKRDSSGRDYHREYEKQKENSVLIYTQISKDLCREFDEKLAEENMSRFAKTKQLITDYVKQK